MLRAGIGADHYKTCQLAYRTRYFAAMAHDFRARFFARAARQGTGEDEGHFRESRIFRRLSIPGHLQSFILEAFDQLLVRLLGKKISDAVGDFRPDFRNLDKLFFSCFGELWEGGEMIREELSGALADEAHAQRVNQAR